MSERRSSFERREANPEVEQAERFAEETRTLLRDFEARRESSENQLTPEQREIIEKILLKLDLKSDLSDAMRTADDTSVYNRMKKLGVLLIFDRQANIEWRSADGAFELAEGDSYIDVHLPPINQEDRIDIFTRARHSFELLARYIEEQQLEPKYVMGVTYEKLANVARRYGFETLALDIPEDIREGVERVYEKFRKTKKGESMGKILLCYQSIGDFLELFREK